MTHSNFLLYELKVFLSLQIHVFLVFCIFTIITSILMFWIILPVLVSGEKEVSWNLFFGSFLGVVAITFVVSMKGAFVAFKSSFFQYNCCNKPPHLQVDYQCQCSISFVCNNRILVFLVASSYFNISRFLWGRSSSWLRRILNSKI